MRRGKVEPREHVVIENDPIVAWIPKITDGHERNLQCFSRLSSVLRCRSPLNRITPYLCQSICT
jgi:hypothetical protein